MAILEEIAFSAGKPTETGSAILITSRQHQNSQFASGKKRTFGRSGGFQGGVPGQWCAQEMLCSIEIRKTIGKAIVFLIASC
ncbi:hypothetical protein GOY39_027710 (plasmid) [Klebsiella pneumoniae]|uniref:hypothetical protein n=1 Tax=Klebsiella pneumoniae TaxID=573 RepID=UPI001FAD4094|nr:hypothetical protein [Klebsiella pneumoniae]MCI7994896.1 hypothetical protein [Klebsiella pneumoniae]